MLEKPPDENLKLRDYLINLFSRISHCFMNFFFCCCISRNDASVEEIIPCLGHMPTLESSTQTDFLPFKTNVSRQAVQFSNATPVADSITKSDLTASQESPHQSIFLSDLSAIISPDSKSDFFCPEEDINERNVVPDLNEDSAPVVKPKSVTFRLEEDICEANSAQNSFDSEVKITNFLTLYDVHDQRYLGERDDELASDTDSFYTAEPMHTSKLSYDSDLGSCIDSGTESTRSESYHTVDQASEQDESECLSLQELTSILGPSVKHVGHGDVKLISVTPCPDICKTICSKALQNTGQCNTANERNNNTTEKKYSPLGQCGSQDPDSVSSSSKGNSEKKKRHSLKEQINSLTGVSAVPWPDDFRDFEEIDLDEEVQYQTLFIKCIPNTEMATLHDGKT